MNAAQTVIRDFMNERMIRDAAKLWIAGDDTVQIARMLSVPEADIYNRMPAIRRAALFIKHTGKAP